MLGRWAAIRRVSSLAAVFVHMGSSFRVPPPAFTSTRAGTTMQASVRRNERVDGSSRKIAPSTPETISSALTSAVFRVSYDGTSFTGWSAGNDAVAATAASTPTPKRRRLRMGDKGYVRSVQGVLQQNLAKLYGNIDPARIVVEGCSRTDKGVHAVGMVAHVYCLTENYVSCLSSNTPTTIPGKRLPHPSNATDATCFVPLPKSPVNMAFSLNRMCFDAQIMAVAPMPTVFATGTATTASLPFHASQSTHSKTYRYTFSLGPHPDPTQLRRVWHVDATASMTDDNNDNDATTATVEPVCRAMEGTHDFSAWQGAPRGATDQRKRTTASHPVCTLHSVQVRRVMTTWTAAAGTTTYQVEITGDRFLYKMVRFLVGALVAAAQEKVTVGDVERLLEAGACRNNEFECAPAHGLVMHEVHYDFPMEWQAARS